MTYFATQIMEAAKHLLTPLARGIALSAVIAAAPIQASAAETPPLMPGDVVKVNYLEYPELSGEAMVEGDGNLAFPSGERVLVVGLSLVEAEQRVREGLTEGSLRNPTLTITISKRVPVAVIGDVSTPGEYEYTSGMVALRAIASAGGYGTHSFTGVSRSDQLAREYADAAELVARLNAVRAQVARLTAEQRGEVFEAPAGASETGFAVAEAELARLRRIEYESERSLVISQIAPIEERIDLLRQTIDTQNEQYRVFSKRVSEIEELARKKLTTSKTLVDLQLTRSRINTDLLNSKAALAGALQDRSKLEKELDRLHTQHIRKISEQRRDALEELSVLYQRFRFTSVSVGDVGVDADGQATFAGAPTVSHSITIMRNGPDGVEEFAAGEKTPVMPGDIVRVRSVLLDGMVESSFTGGVGSTE
ncbi:MAG: polysaccharide biosynthesis/export family protein [Rhodobacteraceae bacterium]|nr:polysaccharide biosynthesis/export family protein [Paracoccaceae bacterium]